MEYNALQKIGYILRFHRRLKEFSQHQMAEALGISTRNFQRIEAGQVEPKLETLMRIAKILEISLSSLVRPTDASMLMVRDVSSAEETAVFQELQKATTANNEDLNYAEKLIAQDRMTGMPDKSLQAQLTGTVAKISGDLANLIGTDSHTIDIHPCVVFGSAAERWEFVFRNNLKQAVIENTFIFPKGLKVFQEFHYNMNPNPDNPTSEIYIRDITESQNLATWISHIKTKKALS
ncbi:helix-turn-helix domain-containing protein [Bdellovibrio sp. HCB337]|uniref:helix-turn-helix domain-containing protein n=1 Tax=Bdellovibrio sp. HCB337 TaxID=3394358 RepID=UPI0039A5F141